MAQNTTATFLVAGAGGRHGATGNYVVRQLLDRELPVRAFVLHADQRSEQLAALGAEIVVGDLRDITAVRGAMRGVARAYFTYPLAEGLLEATTVFAAVGKEAGAQAIVNMSLMESDRGPVGVYVLPRCAWAGRALGADPGPVSDDAVLDRASLPGGGGSPARRVRRGDRRRSENRGSAPEIAGDVHR